MRSVQCGEQQRQTRLLPPRQTPHFGIGLIRPQTEPRQLCAQLGLHHTGARADHMLQRRFMDDQFVHLMLCKEPDAQLAGVDRLALEQHQTVGEQL